MSNLIRWQDVTPNLPTFYLIENIKGECLTIEDVKTVLIYNKPNLGKPDNIYNLLLSSAISQIDWDYVRGYLNYWNSSSGGSTSGTTEDETSDSDRQQE